MTTRRCANCGDAITTATGTRSSLADADLPNLRRMLRERGIRLAVDMKGRRWTRTRAGRRW